MHASLQRTRAHRQRRPWVVLLATALLLGAPVQAHLDPHGWRVTAFSSENVLTGESASHAIDGDPETQWHTLWHAARTTEAPTPPHFLTIDLGRLQSISAVRYRARAHGEAGLPKDYQLELSEDGQRWQTAAQGAFKYRSGLSPHAVITLDQPTKARHLRLTVLSLLESRTSTEPGLVVGEIDVATPRSPLVPTTLIPVPQSREWSYGGYDWQERHRALCTYAAEHPARLIFLGDSINHRWGGPPTDVTPRTGAAVWEQYYGHRNALELGCGWDRLENMLWRLQHGELEASDPRLVVLMAGTNNLEVNSPEEIAAGVAGLCDEIHRQKPRARILLLAIFPRGKDRHFRELDETNRLIAKLGRRSYIQFKDIGSVFLNEQGELTREIMPDLLHPGEEGYRRWAKAIEPEISRALRDQQVPSR